MACPTVGVRSEEHTSELQSRRDLVCRLLLEKKKIPTEAAPLLCAGLTKFNGLRNSKARTGEFVSIQAVGGLGHLGIQFARLIFFFNDTATTEIYTLSLHDALPI